MITVVGISYKEVLPWKGFRTVLFFYPTNHGSTCVNEIVSFQRHLSEFSELGIRLAGVTSEELTEIRDLVEDKQLSLPLFNDPGAIGSALYGVKNAYGFSDRYTFLISEEGVVLSVWQAFDTTRHAEIVLAHCQHTYRT